MLRILCIAAIALSSCRDGVTMAHAQLQPPLRVVPVDALERVFPDRAPTPAQYADPLAVPLGGSAAFQFALCSLRAGMAKVHTEALRTAAGRPLDATVTIYDVLPVTVEANTRQAGTTVGEPAEERNRPLLIRQAPFQAAEVLVATDAIPLQPGVHSAALCRVEVSRTAQPGHYSGAFVVQWEGHNFKTPLAVDVYSTVMPESLPPAFSHWLSASPEDLGGAAVPEPWSEQHWALVERVAKQMHALGDATIRTPLIDGPDPMIRTIRKRDGTYDFDFTRLDRWARTFFSAGYTALDGASIAGGHWIAPSDTYVLDEATGTTSLLFRRGQGLEELAKLRKQYAWPKYRDEFARSTAYRQSVEAYGEFLSQFFDKLYTHLQENDWVTAYRQGLLDEPRTVRDYAYLSGLCRQHMPGVKIVDAIHGYGVEDYEAFSPHVDVWIMEMSILRQPKSQQIIAQRRQEGLQTGLYVLGKTSPWPNRLLDRPLSDNRTQPWLMYLYQADYYIHWAANRYRGVEDPYKHSIGPTGPLRGGRTFTESGHPPGNNWLLYPGPEGLLPSMRVMAFRQGVVDHVLLTMLAKRNKEAADAIAKTIARSATDYETDPSAYHRARKALLEALEL